MLLMEIFFLQEIKINEIKLNSLYKRQLCRTTLNEEKFGNEVLLHKAITCPKLNEDKLKNN